MLASIFLIHVRNECFKLESHWLYIHQMCWKPIISNIDFGPKVQKNVPSPSMPPGLMDVFRKSSDEEDFSSHHYVYILISRIQKLSMIPTWICGYGDKLLSKSRKGTFFNYKAQNIRSRRAKLIVKNV